MLRLKSVSFKFEVILNIPRNFDISRDPFLSHVSVYVFLKPDTILALLLILWLGAKFCLLVHMYRFIFRRTWLGKWHFGKFFSHFHKHFCITFISRRQRFFPFYKPSYHSPLFYFPQCKNFNWPEPTSVRDFTITISNITLGRTFLKIYCHIAGQTDSVVEK